VLGSEDVPDLYVTPEDQDAEFTGAATADVAASFADWRTECELARKAAAAAPTSSAVASWPWSGNGADQAGGCG
jgi:hypothetical protein